MRVLIVKTSSMGDLIHTLPAVTDAKRAIPDIVFDWVAEETFSEIPGWHPAVDRVHHIALRRWRKNIVSVPTLNEVKNAVREIRSTKYDYIIDAQGLIKSAVITRLARGHRCGMDKKASRESLAAVAYQKKISIPGRKDMHAIERLRQLFSKVLGYRYESGTLDYGIKRAVLKSERFPDPYLVFLHGTSRSDKLWPLRKWEQLATRAGQEGLTVYLPWGNEVERHRASRIADSAENCTVLPKMNLFELSCLLSGSTGVVGVDTGLAHLSAALSVPAVTVYTATDPALIGVWGNFQTCLAEQPEKRSLQSETGLKVEYCSEVVADSLWSVLQENIRQGQGE